MMPIWNHRSTRGRDTLTRAPSQAHSANEEIAFQSLDQSSLSLRKFQDDLSRVFESRVKRDTKRLRLKERAEDKRREDLASIQVKLRKIKVQLEARKSTERAIKNIEMIKDSRSKPKRLDQLHFPPVSHSMPLPFIPSAPYLPSFQHHERPYRKPRRYYQPESEQSDIEYTRPSHKKRPMRKDKVKIKHDRERLRRIMRKGFRAVAYYFFLKKLSQKIRATRRALFDKYWPQNFQKSTVAMRKWFSSNCSDFFKAMRDKNDTEIHINQDDSESKVKEKRTVVKKLMKILIQCLQKLCEDPNFEQICRIVLFFCKHGAFVEDRVLTPEEAEIVCISDAHGYLRLDWSLQKSQIINFLFMKIILYNMMLQPWKYSPQFQIKKSPQAYENFFFISSVFYQIMHQIQNDYLGAPRSDCIATGNWRQVRSKFKILFCSSLIHLESQYENGEMISGLVPQKFIDSVLPRSFWRDEVVVLKAIVQKMHLKLRKSHWKVIGSVLDYKKFTKN